MLLALADISLFVNQLISSLHLEPSPSPEEEIQLFVAVCIDYWRLENTIENYDLQN